MFCRLEGLTEDEYKKNRRAREGRTPRVPEDFRAPTLAVVVRKVSNPAFSSRYEIWGEVKVPEGSLQIKGRVCNKLTFFFFTG